MSNHDQYPSSSDARNVQEQIPHSGIHHDENPPVRKFDKTSLEQAHAQGLIETPHSPEALLEPAKAETTSRWSMKQKVAATVGTLILGAGAAIGISEATGGGKAAPTPDGSHPASAPAVPGQNASPAEKPSSEVAAEAQPTPLSVEKFGHDGEALTYAFENEMIDWVNSGFKPGDAKIANKRNMSLNDYAAEKAAPIDAARIDTLFVKDWRSNPNLVKFINSIIDSHHTNALLYLMTSNGSDARDIEPYATKLTVESVSIDEQTPTEVKSRTRWAVSDNHDKNHAAELITDDSTVTGGDAITFVKVGDQFKVSDVLPNIR